MNYSIDTMKKFTFINELNELQLLPKHSLSLRQFFTILYLKDRIDEIDELYKKTLER